MKIQNEKRKKQEAWFQHFSFRDRQTLKRQHKRKTEKCGEEEATAAKCAQYAYGKYFT